MHTVQTVCTCLTIHVMLLRTSELEVLNNKPQSDQIHG